MARGNFIPGGGGGGSTVNVSNLGSGSGVGITGTGVSTVQLKSLVAGSNVTLTPSGTSISIAASGGGGGGGAPFIADVQAGVSSDYVDFGWRTDTGTQDYVGFKLTDNSNNTGQFVFPGGTVVFQWDIAGGVSFQNAVGFLSGIVTNEVIADRIRANGSGVLLLNGTGTIGVMVDDSTGNLRPYSGAALGDDSDRFAGLFLDGPMVNTKQVYPSGGYSALSDDFIIWANTASSITLPSSSARVGQIIIIVGTAGITVNAQAGEQIANKSGGFGGSTSTGGAAGFYALGGVTWAQIF